MNSRTNKKRNKNTTQKLWMNAPHNKNKKNRYFSRLSNRRSRRRRNNNDVFGDLAVPSLHDVTLKMHNVIDHADNAMLSFKPINYKRIHKRWKNKKYKVVSGGVGDGDEKLAEVKKGIVKLTGDVDALTGKVADIENGDATVSPGVAPKDYECLDSKEQRTFSGRLQADNNVRISEVKTGTYDAFIEELAALGETATADADDDEGVLVEKEVVKEVDGKKEEEKKVGPIVPDSATATNVDAAAAAAAGAAGAAAAAALFTDDRTPVIISPNLSDFTIDPNTVTIGGTAPTIKLTSDSIGAITYSSNNETVAKIDVNTGVITLVGQGKVTFTATQAATGQYSTATKTSNTLTVNPAPPPALPPPLPPPPPGSALSEPLRWADLKSRWVEVNGKCTAIRAYLDDLDKDAGSSNIPQSTIGVTRKKIFDWLQISNPNFTNFDIAGDNATNSKNQKLYEALSSWIAKWNEYSGKIRVIVSIKGGGNTGTNKPTIQEGDVFNTTKTTFRHDYKVPQADRTAYGLGNNQYGNFYAGFDAIDSNTERYTKGNFKEMIETLLKGGNAAIFGYGYSGSGKTYTLTNYNASNNQENGIAIQLLEELLIKRNEEPKFTIQLSISELYCSDFKITNLHNVEITKPPVKTYPINPNDKGQQRAVPSKLRIESVGTFITAIETVKTDRIKEKHIKYTLNNPESSRGHLFYEFTLISSGEEPKKKLGTLTIVDMGGRENPVELSESSHMVIDPINNPPTTIGQIVERTGSTTAVFFTKDASTGAYPSEPDKTIDLTESNLCEKIKHITGGFHADEWGKCPSILAPSFGGLFYLHPGLFSKDDATVFDTLPLSDNAKKLLTTMSPQQKTKIKTELKTFLEACKEGVYINETINHLVAYINFLSNIPKIKDIPKNIANKNATGKGTLISLDGVDGKKTEYTYHPKRFIIDPLKYIKSKHEDQLRKIIADQVDEINVVDDDAKDTIGILEKLMEIKKPGESTPAIICFIACVRNDNALLKNQKATKATLEFAMSVSASNAPPSDLKILPIQPPVSRGPSAKKPLPEKDIALITTWLNKLTLASDKIKYVVVPWVKTWLKNKSDKSNKNKFINFLREKNSKFLIGELSNKEHHILDELKSKVLIRYLRYIIDKSGDLGLLSVFTTSIVNVNTGGYNDANKQLVIDAKDLTELKTGMKWLSSSGGSGIRTRKRESRREKKNRITRRRNRV